jgi:hypothetical protein
MYGRGYNLRIYKPWRLKIKNPVTDFNNLYRAYQKTMLGKSEKPTALKFSLDAVKRIIELADKLESRTYKIGSYYTFRVYEPKEREVMAIDFEGKVMQHSLCDNFLYDCFTRSFILDNYASQKGKGTHYGLDRLAQNLRHYYFSRKAKAEKERKETGLPPGENARYADGWVLKGDIRRFFYSLDHQIIHEKAMKRIRAYAKDPELEDFLDWLLWEILNSTPGIGIPIGNQTSQLFALLFLDDMDHLIKDDWGIKIYGRYMDDFYIILESKSEVREILARIEAHTMSLGIELNSKTQIFPLRHGIDFLGFRTYLTDTGKVIRKPRKKSKTNMKRKIRIYRKMVDDKRLHVMKAVESYKSWCSHISHGNTYLMRQKMDDYFYSVFPEIIRPRDVK